MLRNLIERVQTLMSFLMNQQQISQGYKERHGYKAKIELIKNSSYWKKRLPIKWREPIQPKPSHCLESYGAAL
ncbi:hypothetical protein FGO68_gene7132 [Halteria grandinella]|uniref:Uncharacterized protein n=1 Tax=Halteria grandinella TaxID=5974 RepID=A0A8J8T0W9_HALGN|nr:hypothetical protein FGO68_gene7132 [Halteria grandinella]